MVFQEPYDSLNPRMRIGTIVGEPLRLVADLAPRQRQERVVEVLGLVGFDQSVLRRYPHQLSAGAQQRIGLARALVTRPDLVVLDEPTSALDRSVQKEIVELLRRLQAAHGLAYVFISHDLAVVRALADRILVMRHGRTVETGSTEAILERPKHPYTRELISAAFSPVP
jgi:ABC-type microcin C transport system duplicated ATPase subunit YejF